MSRIYQVIYAYIYIYIYIYISEPILGIVGLSAFLGQIPKRGAFCLQPLKRSHFRPFLMIFFSKRWALD